MTSKLGVFSIIYCFLAEIIFTIHAINTLSPSIHDALGSLTHLFCTPLTDFRV
ncbi:hypothetical protein CPB83DRAFT_560085 [Crepidotus variabilis]|uniref:Uncharacterized protein n=1 Tax=Crepidotus variabilis TaxID=179855 RepID=A0A9P6EAB3_9AGAR|nr:hypothetical protein CPB83DRAFT_560085 [Crepidotus variabilis]